MYTQCPKCLTIFAIDEDALQASLGIVRCGHCAERFDALLTLSDRLPSDPAATLPMHDPGALAPTLTDSITPGGIEPVIAGEGARPPAAATAAPTAEPVVAPPDEAWFSALSDERTQALIADAAGIPADAIQGDAAWQVVELPVQNGDIELDTIPLVPAADTESANDLSGAESAPFVEAVESEPFTGPWTVDIPVTAAPVEDRTEAPITTAPAAGESGDGALADGGSPAAETGLAPSATQLLSAEDPAGASADADATGSPEPDAAMTITDTDIAPDILPDPDDAPANSASPDPAEPVYVPPRHRRIHRSEWLWAAGCLALALGLAAQVAWASRVALVLDPATQSWALHACGRIACHLPPIRDTARLELLSRDIRPDPRAAHALSITATFRNNAPFRQPWPVVVVRLTDLDNDTVAMRRFRPSEYLPDPRRRAAGIPPGTTAAVAFEVADPGPRAVSFNFGFE